MKIIAGLGNPDQKYAHSRHNAGFIFVDYLATRLHLKFQAEKKLQAALAKSEIIYRGESSDLLLIKPLTMMNNSGQALRAVLDYYYPDALEEESNHLIVAHDDLDLELGEFKLQRGKGPKIHNGLQSVYQHLGMKNFWHLRLGVDSRQGLRNQPSAAYVLQKMSAAEERQLQQAVVEAFELLLP